MHRTKLNLVKFIICLVWEICLLKKYLGGFAHTHRLMSIDHFSEMGLELYIKIGDKI